MTPKTLSIGLLVLGLSAIQASAQEYYGAIGLSYQNNDGENTIGNPAVDAPNNEPLDFGQTQIDLTFGARFNNGYYGQLDLSYMETDVLSIADDTLHDGTTIALRGGRNFDRYRLGVFLGYIDATIDDTIGDNKVYRTFGGIEGRYDISPKLWATGELGGIGGPKGNHGSFRGDDGIHSGSYVIAGIGYQLNDKLSFEGSLGYADGTTDDDPTYVKMAGIGVNYTFNNPAITAYARLNFTDYYQAVEDEGMSNNTLKLGISYKFGAKGTGTKPLRPLAPIVDWLGYTGGHLE